MLAYVLLAYVDESGDSGYAGSATYSLGCVLVEDVEWPDAFEGFLSFRRFVRASFGIRVRDELKANFLIRGGGSIKHLGLGTQIRHDLYRQHLRLAPKLGLDVFAVVVEKQQIMKQTMNPRDIAWEFLVQRLERLSTKTGEPIMIIHDEGEASKIRTIVRKARRINMPGSAFGTGRMSLPARLIIDDPVPRNSQQSYFVQLADMAAYAAYRRLHPPPVTQSVCPTNMWDQLGTARFAAANQLATATGAAVHPGIVVWP